MDLIQGDCLEILKTLPDNSVDACVTDPPYGLKFMGKKWDYKVPSVAVWSEVLRVLKPGAFLLSFGGTRTYHRMVVNIEDAGFEIRDQIQWLYGCLSEDTEILTINGWERYHKTIDKHPVLSYNIENDTFEFQKPTRKFLYENKHTAYRIQSDSTDQIVSKNHNCIIEHGGKKVFERAEQVARKPEASVPFLESLSELPDNIFNSHEGTSVKKSILQKVCWDNDRQKEQREKTKKTNLPDLRYEILSNRTEREKTEGVLLRGLFWKSKRLVEKIFCKRKGEETSRHRIEGGGQPGVEGRSNISEQERKVCRPVHKICEMSKRIFKNGKERRVCDGTQVESSNGNKKSPNEDRECPSPQSRCHVQRTEKFDAVCDKLRPQEIRMGSGCRTTLATITPIKYSGKIWCVQVPSGAFVARRNGKIFITGNSGFPKSLDVGKAIDKAKGQYIKGKNSPNNRNSGASPSGCYGEGVQRKTLPNPQSPEAEQWNGWGTALKPANEPICLARKPLLEKTVAANVLKWGTGGLNIDGCRVETEELKGKVYNNSGNNLTWGGTYGKGVVSGNSLGRFPANVITDGSDEVVGLFPDTKSGAHIKGCKNGSHAAFGKDLSRVNSYDIPGDSGSAARFFYVAKASKAERGEGNNHVTVKPLKLMCYLCRLVTPPGGTVLDCYVGSGTTGVAAQIEGFDFIGIDKDIEIATRRIEGTDPLFQAVEVMTVENMEKEG